MLVTDIKIKSKRRFTFDIFFTGIIFISIGALFIGRNLGYVDNQIFSILISWQMLLVVLGLYSIFHRGYFWGASLISLGTFFLIPDFTGAGQEWLSTYWPAIFVLAGIFIIMRMIIPRHNRYKSVRYSIDNSYSTDDGFVIAENNMGSLRKLVIDEVFRGADIKNSFGGMEIDLRRSKIEDGEVIMNIESSFGGIDIRIPPEWMVIDEINSSFGGVHDKRLKHNTTGFDTNKRIILKGKISFSGIEIKN